MDEKTLAESIEKLHELFDRTDLEVERKKINEKMEEARYSPGDLRPLVDCIFSLFLAARSAGYSVPAVLAKLDEVAADNLAHRWRKLGDGTYTAT